MCILINAVNPLTQTSAYILNYYHTLEHKKGVITILHL